jgi:outer membrane protein, multidrug efflux system
MKYSIKRYHIIIVLAATFAVSCNVSKEYQRPEVELPKQFTATPFSDTSSIADIGWKEFFTDKNLQTLIESGISNNHDLLIAAKRIDIAQQQLKQARLLQLPELDLQISAQYNRPSNNSLNGLSIKNFLGKSHVENYTALASISWEADIWGKLRAQKETVAAQYLQSYEGAKAVQTGIVAGIAEGYFNLLMLDRQLEIAKKTLLLTDSFLSATKLLKDAGLANALAVQQAEAQKQSTLLLIPQLEESIGVQENALQLLTGQLPGNIRRTASIEDIPLANQLNTGIPAAIVSRRPDVRSNELALQIANAQTGIAQANMYPALNLTAGAGLESFKASNWFNVPNALFGLAAGTIAQPVFRRRELKTAYEVAKLEREQAVIRFRQSVLRAVTEVSNALVQVQKAKEQEQIATAQVAALQSAISNAHLLFKSDLATYLEVITAQSNALSAELNLTAIHGRQWAHMIELYRALGGGWR